MKKLRKIILFALLICALMYAEYRYIMTNITPACDHTNNTIYLEVFGQVDEYSID